MLKFTSIVGYTSCGPTYIESFLTIFGQFINVLNYNGCYLPLTFTFMKGEGGGEILSVIKFTQFLHNCKILNP